MNLKVIYSFDMKNILYQKYHQDKQYSNGIYIVYLKYRGCLTNQSFQWKNHQFPENEDSSIAVDQVNPLTYNSMVNRKTTKNDASSPFVISFVK